MSEKRSWLHWLKILGLFLTATLYGRSVALISRWLAYFSIKR